MVGVPIVFSGVGEKLTDLELFQPDRVVSRMLGMGDILTLVERAEQAVDRDDAERLAEKLRRERFTLEDLRSQMDAIGKMGPVDQLVGMIPGLGQKAAGAMKDVDPKELSRTAAIIDSMTPIERRNPSVINGSRREAYRPGERDGGAGCKSAAQAVCADEKDVEERYGRDQAQGQDTPSREAGTVPAPADDTTLG